MKLGQGFFWVALLASLVFLLTGGALYTLAAQRIHDYSTQDFQATVKSVATHLSHQIDQHRMTLAGIAADPDVMGLLRQPDSNRLLSKADALTALFQTGLRIRLLPVDIDEPDQLRMPVMGYADLVLARTVIDAKTRTAAKAVIVGTAGDQQHLALARAVQQADGTALGAVLGSFSVAPVVRALSQLALSEGRIELHQETLSLAGTGVAALAETEPSGELSVAGSDWTLVYWLPASRGPGWSGWGIALVAGVLLLVLPIWLLHRKLNAALAHDSTSIVQSMLDMLTGQKKHHPVQLVAHETTITELLKLQHYTPVAQAEHSVLPDDSKEKARTKSEAQALQSEGVNVKAEVEVPAEVFRAYDIRGIVEESLTPQLVYDIGRAFGSEAYAQGQQTVVIGRDGRLSSPELSEALARGLQDSGRKVIDVGMVPTPVLYFATHFYEMETTSGIMITGSHNPPNYNGLKMVLASHTLANDSIQKLRTRIQDQDFTSGDGVYEKRELEADYLDTIKSDIELGRSMKVVVDCGNGVAGHIAPRLLKTLGCDVIELYCDVDGTFPNHHPDPSKPENLKELIDEVRSHNADIGVAFDGDGDRLGVVDSEGVIIWPDRQMMVFAADVLSREPGADIIFDVKCSRNLATEIVKHGGKPVMWKTGHSLVKAKIKETGAALAGEMSGHIFFKERWYGFDDGIYACARLLETLSADARSSHDIFAELPDSVNTPELNVSLEEGENFVFIEKMKSIAKFPNAKIIDIDGLRVEFPDGWGLVRASNTTPSLVIRFEAKDERTLKRLQAGFGKLMTQVKPDIQLPF